MTADLTDWFDGEVRPLRKGDYQVFPLVANAVRWSYWNGRSWSFFTIHQSGLDGYRNRGLHAPGFKWRGLAADPAKDAA